MEPTDRAHTFEGAPLDELLSVLLRQLKRPLGTQGFKLTDAEANEMALQRVQGAAVKCSPELLAALAGVVQESQTVLARWGLTFQKALDADLSSIGGWQTTAEFLDIANEKSNAELRITLGSALGLVFGGDKQYAPDLLFLARGDYGDESVIARRVLTFAAGVDISGSDWLTRVKAWSKKD
ncbi:MAG: hypothetical protein R3E39_28605 [Anaerolineae bacterium]